MSLQIKPRIDSRKRDRPGKNELMRATIGLIAVLTVFSTVAAAQTTLEYSPAPADNPLKGLVPYAGDKRANFPHSMEFSYLPLSDLMIGPDLFDWQPLEELLDDIASRQHQAVIRIWMEYPGRNDGIPRWLENQGVKVTEWLNTNTEPFPQKNVRTPDYNNPKLRSALKRFIAAIGARYDADPRIGFITAGLLGTWGEWHTYPRTDLMPGKAVQAEVMDAFELHFKKTSVLLRYPAGENNFHYAANHKRQLGYHDDSFAWATLDTGREEDNWFFIPALNSAGPQAVEKWKTQPIGGEIRPELWGQIFDDVPKHPNGQDFAKSVQQTHASWLMDTGMFETRQTEARIKNAIREVQRMGYEFHLESYDDVRAATEVQLKCVVRNTGVAPFYYDWKFEVGALDIDNKVLAAFTTKETLQQILPNSSREILLKVSRNQWPKAAKGIAIRVANPLANGMPLRFANSASIQLHSGWLKLAN